MAGDTSAPERELRVIREPLRFSTIIIVGGGCYGSYYIRQLLRAHTAGAAFWNELIVVDRNAACAAAALPASEIPPGMRLEIADWNEFFDRFLSDASKNPDAHSADAIVPSPLMPHLLAQWIVARARRRWPGRTLEVLPLASEPDVPWQRAGEDGTHYVSFAEWMCPINCVEPARCPATKGPRDWSMPVALGGYASAERDAGRPLDGPYVFHCAHRTYGVGMIDVRDVLAADTEIAETGAARAMNILIGTASHCHGALQRVVLGNTRERNGSHADSF
jgi:hypothetical protein